MQNLDLIGVGIGPFNLSLAAQLDGVDGLASLFLDAKPAFSWHPEMLLPGAELQTSFLKDLVTLTNPTSPWSFVAYLVARKRLLDYLHADFDAVPRREFAAYLAWVAEHIGSLRFGSRVREVRFEDGCFTVETGSEFFRAKNLSLGIGLHPFVPACAEPHRSETCFHSSSALAGLAKLDAGRLRNGRVAVIGGGQSGAEIVLHLLSGAVPGVRSVLWLSRRPNLEPIDDTPFVNEYFTPDYVNAYGELPLPRRRDIVSSQKLASDGASVSTLKAIRQSLYRSRHHGEGQVRAQLCPGREVLEIDRSGGEYRITCRNRLTEEAETHRASALVLATGYEHRVPDFMGDLTSRLAGDGLAALDLDETFCARWDGPSDRRIFVQNAGRVSRGIFDPQLSLMAWRSAVIVNALAGRAVFDLDIGPSPIQWRDGRDGAEGEMRLIA